MTPQPNYASTSSWPQPSPPFISKPPQISNSKWGSYSNAKTLDANMAIILIILACAAVLAFSLHAAGRLILRLLALRRQSLSTNKHQNGAASEPASSSPIVFSAETKLARAEAECAICLSEFIDGERVRVLPNCGHGFHANCVEEWIVARSSCPTCRATCRLDAPSSEEPTLEVLVSSH